MEFLKCALLEDLREKYKIRNLTAKKKETLEQTKTLL